MDDDREQVEAEKSMLLCWGCGEFGQHGYGHNKDIKVSDLLSLESLMKDVSSVACGASHTLALTDDGKLFSWGNGNSGQLGLGKTQSYESPQRIDISSNVKGIACGSRHSYMWTEEGKCYSFGNNFDAQLGYDFRRPDYKENQGWPLFVDTLLNEVVCHVACGTRHSLFLFESGTIAGVGCNNKGQLGNNTKLDSVVPVKLPDMYDVVSIGCGSNHSLAATSSGAVLVWGYSKACGVKNKDVLLPQCKLNLENDSVKKLFGGDSHSMVLTTAGRLYTWGSNFEGQLGLGDEVGFAPEAKLVNIMNDVSVCLVRDITCGENTCAALTEPSGCLFMWGINASCIIRDDKPPRSFEYRPYHVDLGHWIVHKVALGSWHVAVVASYSPKNVTQKDYSSTSNSSATCDIEVDSLSLSESEYSVTSEREEVEEKYDKYDEGTLVIEDIPSICESQMSEIVQCKVVEKQNDIENRTKSTYNSAWQPHTTKTPPSDFKKQPIGNPTRQQENSRKEKTRKEEEKLTSHAITLSPYDHTEQCITPHCIDMSNYLFIVRKESFDISKETDCSAQGYRTVLEYQYDKFPESEQEQAREIPAQDVQNENVAPKWTSSNFYTDYGVDMNRNSKFSSPEKKSFISKKSEFKPHTSYPAAEQSLLNNDRTLGKKRSGKQTVSTNPVRTSTASQFGTMSSPSKVKDPGVAQYHGVLLGDIPRDEASKEHFAKIQDVLSESKRAKKPPESKQPAGPRPSTMARSRTNTNLKDPFNDSVKMKPVTKLQRTLSFTQTTHRKNVHSQPIRAFSEGEQSLQLKRPKIPARVLPHDKEKPLHKVIPAALQHTTSSDRQIPTEQQGQHTDSTIIVRRNIKPLRKPMHKGTPVFSSGASWRRRTDNFQ